jgi:hypothetical protein
MPENLEGGKTRYGQPWAMTNQTMASDSRTDTAQQCRERALG